MRNFKRIAAVFVSATMLLSTMSLNAFAAVMSVADATAAVATDIADNDLVKATLESSVAKVAPGGTFDLVLKVAGQNDPAAALNVGSLLTEIKYDVNSFDLACAIAEDNAYTDEGRKSVPFALYDALCTVNAADSKIVLGDVAPFKVIPSSDFAVFTVTVKEGTADGQYRFIVPYVAATTPAGKALAYETPYEIIVEVSKDATTPTEPPATEPPVTEPPVTEPPVTEPPVTATPDVTPTPDVSETPTEAPAAAITLKVSTIRVDKAFDVTVTREDAAKAGQVVVTITKEDGTVVAENTADVAVDQTVATVDFAALSGVVKNDKLTVKVSYLEDGVEVATATKDVTVRAASTGGNTASATTPVISGGTTTAPTAAPTEDPTATADPTATTDPDATEAPAVESMFVDVPVEAPWAAADIDALAKAGIVNGVSATEFDPNANVTREQFVKMIVGALGLDLVDTAVTFNDVEAGQYYVPYIATAVANGIVKGMSDEWFGVGENITREDMATIIYRAIKLTGTAVPTFSDAAEISSYAQPAVAELASLGVITGYEDGTFRPQNNATRAEAAVVINRVLSIIAADSATDTVAE